MLPKFDWKFDQVAFHIPIPVKLMYPLWGLAALGVVLSYLAYRRRDTLGLWVGLFIALGGAFAATTWGDSQPEWSLRYYSLLFVGVFLGGYWLLKWQITRGGGDEEDAGDFIVYGVLGVLGGARIGHVLFYDLDKALADPTWVLKIWTGGLASHGAVMGLIFVMYLFTREKGVAFLEGADRFAFSAALGATLVRIGNFFNSEIVGIKTDQTWGVRFLNNGEDIRDVDAGVLAEIPYRHPSQLYETAIGLLVMLGLFVADRAWGREKRPRGALISLFFALYFPMRFGVEFFKEHQVFRDQSATFDMGHYLSIPGMLLGVYGLWWSFNRRLPVGWVPRDEYSRLNDDARDLGDADVDDEFEADGTRKRRKLGADGEPVDPMPAPPKKKKKKKKVAKVAASPDTAAAPAPDAPAADAPASDAPGASDKSDASD